jgi:hypothetical protein
MRIFVGARTVLVFKTVPGPSGLVEGARDGLREVDAEEFLVPLILPSALVGAVEADDILERAKLVPGVLSSTGFG